MNKEKIKSRIIIGTGLTISAIALIAGMNKSPEITNYLSHILDITHENARMLSGSAVALVTTIPTFAAATYASRHNFY